MASISSFSSVAEANFEQYSIMRSTLKGTVTTELIDYFVRIATSSIVCAPITPSPCSTTASPAHPITPRPSPGIPSLNVFITHLVRRSRIAPAVFVTALCYMNRLSLALPKSARGIPCTRHRISLAALLLATKYTQDRPYRNSAWSHWSELFSLQEVNLMERQLLSLLNFNLSAKYTETAELLLSDETYMVSMYARQSSLHQAQSSSYPSPPCETNKSHSSRTFTPNSLADESDDYFSRPITR